MITVEPLQKSDYPAYLKLVQDNAAHLAFDWVPGVTLESITDSMYARDAHKIMYRGQFIGLIEYRESDEGIELGYWIDITWRNKRVMTTLLENIFRDGKRYIAKVRMNNYPSLTVCRKVGMVNTRQEGEHFVFVRK